MLTYANIRTNKNQPVSSARVIQSYAGIYDFQLQDNRPGSFAATNISQTYLTDNRPQSIIQKKRRDALANYQPVYTGIQKKENKTGLPDNLKSGIENLSGISMDDVKVHYHSDKPAQLNAHAYAKGTDIHIAPGQEKHLPHEAWHVVQQKQGRVRPTMQMKGNVNINDNKELEKEADAMGKVAASIIKQETGYKPMQLLHHSSSGSTVQGMLVLSSENLSEGERERFVSISSLDIYDTEELLNVIEEIPDFASFEKNALKHADGRVWVFKADFRFHYEDPSSLKEISNQLKEREKELNRQPGGFSGKSRTADDAMKNQEREDTKTKYQDPKKTVKSPSGLGSVKETIDPPSQNYAKSELTINAGSSYVIAEIKHYGPWDKGSRQPSQSQVMGVVNAKNYIKFIRQTEDVKGRFEWLHLIGSSLGGLNILGNLVAGTFDANTEEIPMEIKLGRMKEKGFNNHFIVFRAETALEGDSWIATRRLTLSGTDSFGNKITRDYDPMRKLVLTGKEYDELMGLADEARLNNAGGVMVVTPRMSLLLYSVLAVVVAVGTMISINWLYSQLGK